MSKIAFLGLGAMGARMAANLVARDHDVTVWNRNPERAVPLRAAGAKVAASPRAAVGDAEFVISMVRDDKASRLVWLDGVTGAFDALGPDTIALECSTLGLDWTRELSSWFSAADRAFLDAPVVGSRPQAEQAQLAFLVGGARETFVRAEPLLACMGSAARHAGPNGAGALTKLVVNALFAVQVAALAELIGAIRRTDFESERIVEILTATPACSPAAAGAARSMLAGAFAPLFPVALVEKDLGYALAAGGRDHAAPVTTAARAAFSAATQAGFGEEHLTSIAKLYRETVS